MGAIREERVPEEKPQTRGQARRRAMLDAATELFLEKGFERTSLSDVVDRSKGSRSTLYEHFGSKEGLLRAMVEEATARVWHAANWDDIPSAVSEDGLVEMGCRLVRAVTAPEAVAVFRIVVAEGHRVPEVATLFFDLGPRILKGQMAERLRLAQAEGILSGDAPETMAQVFFGTVIGDFHLRAALGVATDWDDAAVERHVRTAVRIFLGGVRRQPCQTGG